MPTTTRQIAKLAGISEQSVRNYSRDYAELLSPGATGEHGPRLFDDTDAQTMRTIAALRKEDVSRADIISRLRRGDIVVDATPSPHNATPNATDGPHAAIMPPQVQSTILARLDALERTQAVLLRAATLWGALLGAVVALAGAAFVIWLLYLMG